MRWLVRSLILWAICLPLFYLFGLPYLMERLSEKARTSSFTECHAHLKQQGLIESPTAILSADQADRYCHCVSDPIALTRADLPDLLRRQPPAHLAEAMKPAVDACNTTLQSDINQSIATLPAPRSTRDENGVETLHFDAPPPVVIQR